MQIIEKLITEYSKSLSTNALVFKNNRKLKIWFYSVFWTYLLASLIGGTYLLFLNLNNWIAYAYLFVCTVIAFPLLQWIKNKAIQKNFPKVKTSIFRLIYPEISELIEKNTEKFIFENKLETKLEEVSNLLGQKLEVTKGQNFVLFAIIGAILVAFLNCFLSSLFDRLRDISISTFIGVSILVLFVIIIIGLGLFFLRKILDDFATDYQKISHIKNYIDDCRLKK